MPGLERILRGILKYRNEIRPTMVKQFEEIRDHPEPKLVMFSCMDSRVIITRLLQANVGDMFLVRNAGNLVPHHSTVSFDSVTTEPGALELGCIINGIRHVVVCGHSDCKAMNALFSIKDEVGHKEGSPLQMWLKKHGENTVEKYKKLLGAGGTGPIEFQAETEDKVFEAYIDPENNFKDVDKFSQVNTLQQLQHIASHPILTKKLLNDQVRLHAMWFDVYSGEFYMFSRERKCFLPVTNDNFNHLAKDGDSWMFENQ